MTDRQKPQYVKFEGKVRWATIPPRQARGPHEDYTTDANRQDLEYSIEVECDEEKFKKLKKAGIPRLTELREDKDTGETYIRIRSSKHRTNPAGGIWEFKDIETYGEDGQPLTESVGNGSEAIVVAELATTKRGKVLRLKSVRVTKLIPYEDKKKSEVSELLGLQSNVNVRDEITALNEEGADENYF